MSRRPKRERVPITMRALVQRLNRALAKEGNRLMKPRSERGRQELGEWCIVDLDAERVVAAHVDPEALARKRGALEAWEEVSNGEA